MSQPYVGQIMVFAFNFAPRNYAYCNGAQVSIAQNQALFSILGTTYGGDGVSNFALPDMRPADPVHHQRHWDPTEPRYLICAQGVYPPRA